MWFKRVWPANRPFVKMKKKIWRTSSSCLKPQMFGPMLVIGSVGQFDCWFSYSRDFGSFSILFLNPCLRKTCKEYLQYIKLKFHILGLSLNMFFFWIFLCWNIPCWVLNFDHTNVVATIPVLNVDEGRQSMQCLFMDIQIFRRHFIVLWRCCVL